MSNNGHATVEAYLKGCNECMVCVKVCNHLEPAIQGNDLAFDMLLQDPAHATRAHSAQSENSDE